MAWSDIAASETDANSPLSQTLMDKIRDNLDYLKSISSSMTNFASSGTGAGTTAAENFVIDDTLDWRDRNIGIRGIVAGTTANFGGLAEVQKILPGGSESDQVFYHDGGGAAGKGVPSLNASAEYDFVNAFMYSFSGSAAYSTPPGIVLTGINGSAITTALYIWVNSSDGSLNLTVTFNVSQNGAGKYAAWNLQLIYSEDLGGV